ncbi:MAG TPA: ATP-binding cassette domain-containing protein [Paracoccaceae bacterium]|nr:ATP-binding cassette domain-containing protein [Paracoccaceae bacterium]
MSLALNEGERVAVVGPEGAGKAQLLRLIDGQLRGWTGRAMVLARPLRPDRPPARRELCETGHVGRELALLLEVTVRQNVLNGRLGHAPVLGSLLGRFTLADRFRAEAAMAEARVAELAGERVGELAPGMQQRVALARCLAQDPRLILIDARAFGREPVRAEALVRLSAECARRRAATLIFASAEPAIALRYADRIVAMQAGRVVLTGTPEALGPGELARLYRGQIEIGQPRLRLVV